MTTKNQSQNLPAKQSEVVDNVLTKVNQFEKLGQIRLPKDYSPENALKSAYLILKDQKDKGGVSVLESCKKDSIANALLDMVVQGLSPMKKQCAFVPYGDQLTLVREYHGTIALARRFGGVKDIMANVIFQADEFAYSIDPETGRKKVTKHVQTIDNIDINAIKGAYAVLILEDGSSYTEVMTMVQIRTAWNQGAMKGGSPAHKNFTDQMALKTVINRACKLFISSSDDGALYSDDEPQKDFRESRVNNDIKENANKGSIDIDAEDAQEVNDDPPAEKQEQERPPEQEPEQKREPSTAEQATMTGPGF
jgi:recombination protein RecT